MSKWFFVFGLVLALLLFFGCIANNSQEDSKNTNATSNNASASSVSDENCNVRAEGECPRGMTNDKYPGLCGAYIDKDNDGICDYSQ